MTNIELPKDANGCEIPLDTKVLYFKDGSDHKVAKWVLYPYEGIRWAVVFDSGVRRDPDVLYLTQPDSWEKLEEDLARCIEEGGLCVYYSPSGRCSTCILDRKDPCSCNSIVLEDIERRIRKLRGEGE